MAKSKQTDLTLSKNMGVFVRRLMALSNDERLFKSGTEICNIAVIIACFHKCEIGPVEGMNFSRTWGAANPPLDIVKYLYKNNKIFEDNEWKALSSLANQGLEIMKKEFDDSGLFNSIEFSRHIKEDLYFKKNDTAS